MNVLVIDSAGTNSFDSLERAVFQARPGAIIRLSEGIYRLVNPLTIEKSLRLEGAGREATQVVCGAPGFVVSVKGKFSFAARGISFSYDGNQPANVMDVCCDLIELHVCEFKGGKSGHDCVYAAGCGLVLRGDVRGLVSVCFIHDNDGSGISLMNKAAVDLENNICENNKSGISYFNSSSGKASYNICEFNDFNGISVGDHAYPVLESNVCRNNGCGYRFRG